MTGREVIKNLMKEKGIQNKVMAERLEISQAALWDRLNSPKTKDIPLSLFASMLKALDYKVIIVPTTTAVGKINGAIRVDGKPSEDSETK